MKITEFAKEIAKREGGKVNLSIAQILEVLKIVNNLFKQGGMDFYVLIRYLRKKRK